jgi:hypothetical protein
MTDLFEAIDDSMSDEDCQRRIEVTDDAERRLIQVRQFTFDLLQRVGMIREIDLPNVCFDGVSFDQCMLRLVDRVNRPRAWDEPYVADIDRFLRSVVTDDERKRYSDLGYRCKTWGYKPWDMSRLAQARRLVLEMEPDAEEWMDKDIEDFSFPDCLSWFLEYMEWLNPDEKVKARINAFLANEVTEADWAYYRYVINSDPLEYLDPPEDGYLDDMLQPSWLEQYCPSKGSPVVGAQYHN